MIKVILIGRIKKWFWHDRVFYSRGQKFKFWSIVLYKLSSILSVVFIVSVSALFVGVFDLPDISKTGHNLDDKSVEVPESELLKVKSKYDSSLEKGFCVYGYAHGEDIRVEEIVHDNEPLVQKEDRVSFLCIDETIDRLPRLMTSRYSLVGNIHTHPNHSRAKLSRGDAFAFGGLWSVQDTFGVYNGDSLEFFSPSSLSYGLDMYVEE